MTSEQKKKEFTVQEADPPVPVGDGGAGTGHPRPLSCDSPASAVAHQAGMQRIVTGWLMEPKKGWNKKSPLTELRQKMEGTRSAPTSPNVSSVDLTWDENSGRSIKRRRQGSVEREIAPAEQLSTDSASQKLYTIRRTIRNIDKEIRMLAKVVQENSNTKREIKDLATSLRSLSSILMTDIMQEALVPGIPSLNIESRDIGTQSEDLYLYRKTSTQTQEIVEERTNMEINRELRDCNSDDNFLKLAEEPWPESLYKHSTVAYGDATESGMDMAFYVTEGDTSMTAKAAARFSELTEMGRDCQEDYAGCLMNVTYTREGEHTSKKERMVYKLMPSAIDGRGPVLEFAQMVRTLDQLMEQDDRDRVALPRPPGISIEEARKVVEYILQGKDRSVTIYEPALRRARNNRSPREEEGMVVVKSGGKSFVDALKGVKEGLGNSEDVKLKAVRKTQNGDILLIVKGGAEGAKTLEDKIRNKTGMSAQARDRDKKTLIIQGLDGVTTKEEVTAATGSA